jgi:dCTP deaminase
MVLSDNEIARLVGQTERKQQRNEETDGLLIDPWSGENLQPASYDLTLGTEWIVPVEANPDDQPITLDSGVPESAKLRFTADSFVLNPAQDMHHSMPAVDSAPFVLGHTQETIRLPPNVTAEVKGRSSIGRLGVIPHTAGWIDPGFEGQITLEFVNHSPNQIKLEAGTRIAQIVFRKTETRVSEPYGDKSDQKYQGQSGVTESRISQDNDR